MTNREIRICEEKEATGGSEIKICPNQDDDIPKEIRICPGDCNNPPELTLTGEDEPSVGDVYNASGGEGVYSFSFDGGSISKTGEILSITNCGGSDGNGAIGSVTVTDSCNQSASITVRLPGGAWVAVGDQVFSEYSGYAHDNTCYDTTINNLCYYAVGDTRRRYQPVCVHSDAAQGCLDAANNSICPCTTVDVCNPTNIWAWIYYRSYKWSC